MVAGYPPKEDTGRYRGDIASRQCGESPLSPFFKERNKMRPYLCHHLNSLHVYCRLLNLGIPKLWAWKLTGAWERVFHPVVYAKPKGGYGR